jgi:hypothetical protein
MNIDVNLILVIALTASIVGHIAQGYMNYRLFQMVLRAISPSLRHRAEPMPRIQAYPQEHSLTDRLDEELQGL